MKAEWRVPKPARECLVAMTEMEMMHLTSWTAWAWSREVPDEVAQALRSLLQALDDLRSGRPS